VRSEYQEYWSSIISIVAAEVEWRETKEKDVMDYSDEVLIFSAKQ
jgi:hypothetical protein